MSKLGIIAALPDEAACLYNRKLQTHTPVEIQKDIFLCLSGIGYEAADKAAKQLLNFNIQGLISWGVAGALDSSLKSGDLIIADVIRNKEKKIHSTDEWRKKLSENLNSHSETICIKPIASNHEICASIEAKQNLFEVLDAAAVDMESMAIAEVAKVNNLDFMAIRSIADQATTAIPEAILNHTDHLGRPDILKFLFSCISKPTQIREIYTLAKSFKIAIKTLCDITPEIKKHDFFYN